MHSPYFCRVQNKIQQNVGYKAGSLLKPTQEIFLLNDAAQLAN